ncbi:MAG: transporter substrate-binding domain-containing protein [Proteobacteria bacterium]|nr:transporter substrate-binding domain-containing protein [Pseudomonadota bacterium]
MKKIIVSMGIMAWLIILAPGVHSSDMQGRIIKIGTDRWPPHEDIFNEAAPGLCTEVVRHVFENMNLRISIVQYPWARAVDLVSRGKNDGLFCALYTQERAEHCYYPTEPIATLKYLLFIKKENRERLPFHSYEDLIDKKIGVVRGFVYPGVFWDFIKKHNNFQEVENDELNFKKLMAGRIDFAIADFANGTLLIKEMGLTDQIEPLLSKVIQESELYILFSKKTMEAEFVKLFSENLRQFKQTEKYKQINEKYYGTKKECCLD